MEFPNTKNKIHGDRSMVQFTTLVLSQFDCQVHCWKTNTRDDTACPFLAIAEYDTLLANQTFVCIEALLLGGGKWLYPMVARYSTRYTLSCRFPPLNNTFIMTDSLNPLIPESGLRAKSPVCAWYLSSYSYNNYSR